MSRISAVVVVISVVIFTMSLAGAQDVQQRERGLEGTTLSEQQSRQLAASELERIIKGFAVSPVALDLNGKDAALVGLGSYLVNAQGGCNDCHTNPSYADGGDPFQGQPKQINTAAYLAGGAEFGPFVSRNLTPDPGTGRPANLTYQQFRRSLRTGVDIKNAHPTISPLLQVMPWPVYQDLTERDLRAIYEFLRAIPHAEPGV